MAATLLTNLLNLGGKKQEAQPRMVERQIQLVVTPIGTPLPGLQCFHTSVLVGDSEYVFENSGVRIGQGPQSHSRHNRQGRLSSRVDYGLAVVDIDAFETTLCTWFRPGSYDLLRKNCNSFSDCALTFLIGQRIDPRYRGAEAFASVADRYLGLVQGLTSGKYRPNPNADGFDLEAATERLGFGRSAVHGMHHVGGPHSIHGGPVVAHGGMLYAI
eukprot:CAMPEP_0170269744 /NCGR_PEP_ID=MMETSP0116_2-20130129/34814_1 /TAXON_ID=400756 /ORGANISM="Durinskia baltica, Strain CSIRO CS-38" /LENGTH=214 /DNA_ID=CAMNT_0010520931 /DNA_START=21 /DNA_END=665 /DNA_ORIENTATION=+